MRWFSTLSALALAVTFSTQSRASTTYAIDQTFGDITLTGTFTTDGTTGTYSDRAAFSAIVESYSVTASAPTVNPAITWNIFTFANADIGADLVFEVTADTIVITSETAVGDVQGARLFSLANTPDSSTHTLELYSTGELYVNNSTDLVNPYASATGVSNLTFTAVPEPGALALLGAAGVVGVTRRRR